MSVVADAMAKIRAEMDGQKDDAYIQVIGEFLLQQLNVNPKIADKIIAGEKTIVKSIDEMVEEARKKERNGRTILTDAEGFAIVLRYYGVDVCVGVDLSKGPDYSAVNPTPDKKAVDFEIRLEDLLRG